MTQPAIAATIDAVDPAWMTAVLRASGALPTGRVTSIDIKPVGNGLVGDSYRMTLGYEGAPETAPASVVGKFAAADPGSRATGAAFNL